MYKGSNINIMAKVWIQISLNLIIVVHIQFIKPVVMKLKGTLMILTPAVVGLGAGPDPQTSISAPPLATVVLMQWKPRHVLHGMEK